MRKFPIPGWTGINENVDSTKTKPTDWQDSLDVRILDDYSAEERSGYTKVLTNAESTKILDIEQFEVGVTRHEILATKSDVKLRAGTSTSSVLSGLQGNDRAKFLQWNDTLFMSNGIDNIKKARTKSQNFIYDVRGGYIAKKDWDGNELQVSNSNGYDFVYSDGTYLYASDQSGDVIYTMTMDMAIITTTDTSALSTAMYGPRQMTSVGTHLFVEGYTSSGTQDSTTIRIWKILKSDMSYVANVDPAIYSGTTTLKALSSNSTYLYAAYQTGANNSGVKHYDTSFSVVSSRLSFDANNIYFSETVDDSYYYFWGYNVTTPQYVGYEADDLDGSVVISANLPATMRPTTNNQSDGVYRGVINDDNLIISEGSTSDYYGSLVYRNKTNGDMGIEKAGGNLSGLTIVPATGINITEWHDIISPYKMNFYSSGAGNVNATVRYKSTWAGYDTVNDIVLYESSGGLDSGSQVMSSEQVEFYFDFTSSQLTKSKADDLGITHHRVYRKDGSADYRLQGTYPVYLVLAADITATDTTISVDDMKGQPNIADDFWVKIGDEIIKVTSFAGTTLTVERGGEGTTATTHANNSTVYIYGITDNTATASLGTTVMPIENDFLAPQKFMVIYNERFVCANSAGNSSLLKYSGFRGDLGIGDEDLIQTDNFYPVGNNDGSQITGLIPYNGALFVFKERAIYYLSGDLDTTTIDILNENIGCVAPQSIVNFYGGILFLSYDGWMFLYETKIINLTESYLKTTMNNINWDYAYLSSSAILPKYDEVWLAVPTGSNKEPDTVLVINTKLSNIYSQAKEKLFYKFSQNLSALETVIDANGDSVLWGADNSGNLFLQDSGTNDNTGVINSQFTTMDYNFGFPFHKKFRGMLTDFLQKNGSFNLNLQYSIDGGSFVTAHTIDQTGTKRDYDYYEFDVEGHKIKFKYSNANADEPFKVFGGILYWKKHKIRRT